MGRIQQILLRTITKKEILKFTATHIVNIKARNNQGLEAVFDKLHISEKERLDLRMVFWNKVHENEIIKE